MKQSGHRCSQRLYLGVRAAALNFRAAVGATIAAAVLLTPTVLSAELGFPARIGILSTSTPRSSPLIGAIVQELERLGYVEGRNLNIEFRNAENRPERLPDLARELVRLKSDVILTHGTMESTIATMKATKTIPIVFAHPVDPVRAGLVASLAKPGGNVTGVTSLNADLGAKRLELMTEMVPNVRRVAVLVSPIDPESLSMVQAVESVARVRRIRLDLLEIRDPTRLSYAVKSVMTAGADALLVLGSPPLYRLSPSLAQLAIEYRLPAVSAWRAFPEAGGLASFGTDIVEMFQRAAGLVDRVLKGAKPAELPVEQPTNFELVINIRTARTLRLTIPSTVLLRADDIIE
jgi:putative tryptophan/tyrosine transport system substrate-binding protein